MWSCSSARGLALHKHSPFKCYQHAHIAAPKRLRNSKPISNVFQQIDDPYLEDLPGLPYGNGNGNGSHHNPAILTLLNHVAAGRLDPASAATEITLLANSAPPPDENGVQAVGDFALLDVAREARTGVPEVVWGPGKTAEQIASILKELSKCQHTAMATRVEPAVAEAVLQILPDAQHYPVARMIQYRNPNSKHAKQRLPGVVGVVSAGTADLSVVEEAKRTAEFLGCYCFKVADCGVAGLNRLLGKLDTLRTADVLIVVAGMDAALPSVVSGLVEAPVIAVPTSVGYGAAFNGLAPLLSTLNSCSPGVMVVNIDNGFGAASAAARMLGAVSRRTDALMEDAQNMSGNDVM